MAWSLVRVLVHTTTVKRINRFFAQHFGKVFQGGGFGAAEENLAVHVAHDSVCIVLVDGSCPGLARPYLRSPALAVIIC